MADSGDNVAAAPSTRFSAMAPANPDRSAMRSKLSRIRVERNFSQRQLAIYSGVSLRTLRRLERREVDNPPLRYLVNLSLVLRCELSDLIEDEWLAWADFGHRKPPSGTPRRVEP